MSFYARSICIDSLNQLPYHQLQPYVFQSVNRTTTVPTIDISLYLHQDINDISIAAGACCE